MNLYSRPPPRAATGLPLSRGLLLLALLAGCAASPPPLPDPPAAYPAPDLATPAVIASPPLAALPAPALPALPPASARDEIIGYAEESLRRAPQPRQAITTQGLMFTDQAYVESQQAKQDWFRMLALVLAAEQTGQGRYRLAFGEYLDAWLTVYRPSNDPISEADFQYLALAVDRARPWLDAARQQRVAALFRPMIEAYLDPSRYPPGTASNNWQSHRVKLASLMAFAIGDEALLKRCRGAFRRQIAENLRADGRVADFEQRDALRYVTYSLEPLLLASLVARERGQDWFLYQSPGGSSLNQSLRWLADYASGRRQHQEFRNTTVDFDRRRAAAGLPGFSGLWNPQDAVRCYQLAARLDPQWRQLADRLGPAPAWIALLFP